MTPCHSSQCQQDKRRGVGETGKTEEGSIFFNLFIYLFCSELIFFKFSLCVGMLHGFGTNMEVLGMRGFGVYNMKFPKDQ